MNLIEPGNNNIECQSAANKVEVFDDLISTVNTVGNKAGEGFAQKTEADADKD
jgi:hypothetical protein